MYRRIMVPVDLEHAEKLGKAIATAADLAKIYGSEISFVGVAGSAPSRVAHTYQEYCQKLDAFAAGEASRLGVAIAADPIEDHDVAVDLDARLLREAGRIGADLIVMASHMPGRLSFLGGSNAGYVAQHAAISVMIVRGGAA
ncbi:MAG: universal stress protein [Rhodobacteraceae bacterium]|nr:universal stress protein [Paracoccaceae bacterium]